MLEVYDRVLTSRSIPTLVGLSVLVFILFAFQGFLGAGAFSFGWRAISEQASVSASLK
jgi:ABC-type protease/lipase transport system fused ATPase/permease subunit